MNTILEQINSAGLVFVKFALPMLVQSGILIMVLLLADLLMRKKVRAVFRYWLWMLVLIKLVLPTSLSSPVSIGSWCGDKLTDIKVINNNIVAQPVNPPQIIEVETATAANTPSLDVKPIATPPPVARPIVTKAAAPPIVWPVPLTWQGVVFLIWTAVVAAMGLLLLQRVIFVTGLVAQAQNPTQLMNDAFQFCCRRMNIKGKIGLKVSANTASPAVCGLFRPIILVPHNLAPTLGSSHLRPVLLHELAHIRRGDLWINLGQTVLQIIYFYNPLLWLANFIIRRIREQAVDETVQVALGDNAQQYPQALVDVAKLAFNRPVLSLRLIGVVESKSALKGRIERMLNRPIPKTAKLGVLSLAALVVIGFVFLPMAKAAKPEKSNQNPMGIWQSVDFVKNIEDFIPGEKTWPEELYLKNVKFMKNGKTSSFFTWNKNLICHNDGRTNANYQIKEIDGSRYLFLPWLSGDVIIRGQKPKYYVMKEVKDNNENALDFTVALGRDVIVDEGVGFNGLIAGDANCTGEFIKSTFGEPDWESKDEKKGWGLDYRKKYGLDFWLDLQKNTLYEIRLSKGFKGKLHSGISMSSTRQDVFNVYGQPIRWEVAEDFDQRFDNHVLLFRKPALLQRWREPRIAKMHYDELGLLFWFDDDKINQIVISPKQKQPISEGKKQQPADINAKKRELVNKLDTLTRQRDSVQKDLDSAEKSLTEMYDRFSISDIKEGTHPLIERLDSLQKQQDDCTLELSQLNARINSLKSAAQTDAEKKELKDAEKQLVNWQAISDALEKMRADTEAKKRDLDLTIIQYNQRVSVRNEKLQLLNAIKAQIENYKQMYDNPEAFDTSVEVEKKIYSVEFRPKGDFNPTTAKELLDVFNNLVQFRVKTHHFRTAVENDKLAGYILTDGPAEQKAIKLMLDDSDKLEFVNSEALTEDELAKHYAMEQPSLGTIDVAIEDFRINPYPAGGLYTVSVAIRNKGPQEAPPFRLNFYQGDPANNLNLLGKPQTGSNGAGPIKPRDVWNEISMPFALKEGLNEIAVVLDTGRNLTEPDQTNNRAFMRLVVENGQIKENSVSYSPLQKPEKPEPKTDARTDIKSVPYTQEMFDDIQPDGTSLFKTTVRQINQSDREISNTSFINSDFVHVTGMSDAEGNPLQFTSAHQGDVYHYNVIFNKPVGPGELMEYSHEGQLAGLVRKMPGTQHEYKYHFQHWPQAGQPTRRIETHLLPAGAELISKTPEDMQQQIKNGRIELHLDKMIPPGGSITVAFQYRLNDGKSQTEMK